MNVGNDWWKDFFNHFYLLTDERTVGNRAITRKEAGLIEDALESILNATMIDKVVTSKHPRTGKPEKLYIIKSVTYDNLLIYTKGKIYEEHGSARFYILISSKRLL